MPSDIDDLRRELDIVSVVSEYIHLERAGTSYRANCPFHPDRTPSFYVSPSRQIFKCFGCGVGGDAIKFVSLYENVSYGEAAVSLAKRFGIPFKLRKEPSVNSRLYDILSAVADFYHRKLRESGEALEHLRSRSIESATVRRFLLGFSPSSGELVRMLSDMKALEDYEKTGNLTSLGGGRYRDLFYRRLIIPIRDHRGRIVGFGGRILQGEGPKYINSPESEIFRKRNLLYGLHEGLAYLRDTGSALLVEGYFDVITLHQEGFRNAVASLGTSFGREHADLLAKFVSRVYLLFDGDSAGRRAVRLAAPYLLRSGLEVFPVELPEGTDPHDFLRSEGRTALRERISSARSLFDLLLDRVRRGEEVEVSVRDFIYFVSFVRDGVTAYTLLSELSRATRIPVDVLAEKVQRREEPREEEPRLSFTERVFLKGLMELKPDVDLDQLNLSQKARAYAESILREDYYELPEEVLNLRCVDLERDFRSALESLRIDIPEEELLVSDRNLREAVRERIRRHRGGIRGSSLRRWRANP